MQVTAHDGSRITGAPVSNSVPRKLTSCHRHAVAGCWQQLFVPSFSQVYLERPNGEIYKPSRPITWKYARLAFEGRAPLHADLLDRWGRTSVLAVDQDRATWDDAVQVRKLIADSWGLQPDEIHTERTGGSGFHHWVLLARPWSAELLEEAGRRLLDASKADGIALDYVAPLHGRTHIRVPLTRRNDNGARSQWMTGDGRRVKDGAVHLIEMGHHAVEPQRLTFPAAPKKPFDWQPQLDSLQELERMPTIPEPADQDKADRHVPACVRWYESHDVYQGDMRHRVLYGLAYKWVRLDELSDEAVMERAERWYQDYYRAGGSSLQEHMADARSAVRSMRSGARFNCQKWPEVWGDHCDERCRQPRTEAWVRRIRRQAAEILRTVRRNRIAEKVSARAVDVFKRVSLCRDRAERAGAPEYQGQRVAFCIQSWLAKQLGVAQPSISRAFAELRDAGLLRVVPDAVMSTTFRRWLRRNGHLIAKKAHPKYYVVSVREEDSFPNPSFHSEMEIGNAGNTPSALPGHPVPIPEPPVVPSPDEFRGRAATTTTEILRPGALDRLLAAIQQEKDRREDEIMHEIARRMGLQDP